MAVASTSSTVKVVSAMPISKCSRSATMSIILTMICCLFQTSNSFIAKIGKYGNVNTLHNVRHSSSRASLDVATVNPLDHIARPSSTSSSSSTASSVRKSYLWTNLSSSLTVRHFHSLFSALVLSTALMSASYIPFSPSFFLYIMQPTEARSAVSNLNLNLPVLTKENKRALALGERVQMQHRYIFIH